MGETTPKRSHLANGEEGGSGRRGPTQVGGDGGVDDAGGGDGGVVPWPGETPGGGDGMNTGGQAGRGVGGVPNCTGVGGWFPSGGTV